LKNKEYQQQLNRAAAFHFDIYIFNEKETVNV